MSEGGMEKRKAKVTLWVNFGAPECVCTELYYYYYYYYDEGGAEVLCICLHTSVISDDLSISPLLLALLNASTGPSTSHP